MDDEMKAWEAAGDEAWETVEAMLAACTCNGSRAHPADPRPVDSGYCPVHGGVGNGRGKAYQITNLLKGDEWSAGDIGVLRLLNLNL